MSRRLRVVVVTPEIPSFSKSGGLAEFSAALPAGLARLGVDVSVITPRHRTPDGGLPGTASALAPLSVPMDGDAIKAGVLMFAGAGVAVYLIDQPKYFLRDRIYGPAGTGYLDNDERFIFFSRAAVELLRGFDPPADVIHCQDWPTALVPVFLKTHYQKEPALERAATVLTIHNAAEQGDFPPESLAWTGLNWDFFNHGHFHLNGRFNFLKAGIAYSDIVSVADALDTARLAGANGRGLDAALRERGAAVAVLPAGDGPDHWETAARNYLQVYEKALKMKRGG